MNNPSSYPKAATATTCTVHLLVRSCTTGHVNSTDSFCTGSYPRLEVETLQKDEYQWSLFMQALRNIQQKGYKRKPASFQEIGTPSLPT